MCTSLVCHVLDTSVLVDLFLGEVLDAFFSLLGDFVATDFVVEETWDAYREANATGGGAMPRHRLTTCDCV